MNTVWNQNNIIHLELSSYCNAACPLCPRYLRGYHLTRHGINISQVTLEIFQQWFNDKTLSKTKLWRFCGTLGDPLMAKDVIKIIEYIFLKNSKASIEVNTNGGLRNINDWKALGEISSKYDLKITFSIDGLEDTNHLYRRNVKWDVLEKNFSAYINAQGKAIWDFLIFKHNEHQIDIAYQYSKEKGFQEFRAKKALGFTEENKIVDVPVYDKDGNYEYSIFPPSEIENKNFFETVIKLQSRKSIQRDYETKEKRFQLLRKEKLENFIDFEIDNNVEINCLSSTYSRRRYGSGSELYINVNGDVFPCCMIGTNVDSFDNRQETLQIEYRINKIGKEKFNLNNLSLDEILESYVLSQLTENTWKDNSCLSYCKLTCGSKKMVEEIFNHKKYGKKSY